MLRHLVSLLDGVLQCAWRSDDLMSALGPHGWTVLVELSSEVRKLCEREGW